MDVLCHPIIAGFNGILFVIKLAIGLMVGAVSVIADAVHTLSDVVSSAVVIWGFKQSEKPADVEHPYGHGRVEYIFIEIRVISIILFLNWRLQSF